MQRPLRASRAIDFPCPLQLARLILFWLGGVQDVLILYSHLFIFWVEGGARVTQAGTLPL